MGTWMGGCPEGLCASPVFLVMVRRFKVKFVWSFVLLRVVVMGVVRAVS